MPSAAFLAVLAALSALPANAAPTRPPTLFQRPTLSRTHIVFSYGGDLWIVPREGGRAQHLTNGVGIETDPVFSPDGASVAFTGQYDGNLDVYVVPATGGMPRRLTYHPESERAVGWTPDGKRILFRSPRVAHAPRFSQLFTLPVDGGGLPERLPLPSAELASFSPDGTHLAYNPTSTEFQSWKRYRGGLAVPIWIARLSDSHIEKIPRENSNDTHPMWVGDKIYFLSDRAGPVTLFSYDLKTKEVRKVLANDGLDFKHASLGPDAIVYEQFGAIHLYDLASGKARRLEIEVAGDLPELRPRFRNVTHEIRSFSLSPHGARIAFEAHGKILTVPAKKGDVRNLTRTPGVAERDPAWSPDGKWIAYFSDEFGEYVLHVVSQDGVSSKIVLPLGDPPSYYYGLVWSPDSQRIAYTDKRLRLWYVDLLSRKSTQVAVEDQALGDLSFDPSWSPDGQILAFTKKLDNTLRAVFVHLVKTGSTVRITDGMSDAHSPVFDKSGKYLFFTASTDIGPKLSRLDMSSVGRRATRSVYVTVLRRDIPSPLAPESDEEVPANPNAAALAMRRLLVAAQAGAAKPKPVRIDFDGIGHRILALPLPPRDYIGLEVGKPGILFLGERIAGGPGLPGKTVVHVYNVNTRHYSPAVAEVSAFQVSADGEKMAFRVGGRWFIAPTSSPWKIGDGAVRLTDFEVYVEPRLEWRQMFREAWRIERDFFYDPGFHGLDLVAAAKRYEPYLDAVASRHDLNYLFSEMLGELSVGHLFVGGGALPRVPQRRGGLLGADYEIVNGRYRFARVLGGENWNPQFRAPLTQPGVGVKAGEYLLDVNGIEVRPPDNIFKVLQGTAGKMVRLRVGPDPRGKGSRVVSVVPVATEAPLRFFAWIEDNRRKVAAMTKGRVAYVYLPDTGLGGFTAFNRYFFAQIGKEGAVIDERFNAGGLAADYIIDILARRRRNWWTSREGKDFSTPHGTIDGPKAMIINEWAGSGGDFLPWYFRQRRLGPLVGKRTWGGLVGIGASPVLMDGGMVTAPRMAFYTLGGEWEVENRGVAPDVEVEADPEAVRKGRDPQLEKAVELVLQELARRPQAKRKKPAYPNYQTGK